MGCIVLVLVAILTVTLINDSNACYVVSRSSWRAQNPKSTTSLSTPVNMVVIHHTDTPSCSSQSACKARVRSIQNDHMYGRARRGLDNFDDIGYNFLVGGDGTIYEGRGWQRIGAHARGYNSRSIGIAFIGTFSGSSPTVSAQNAAKALISCGVSGGYVSSRYTLRGHKDVGSTQCPGSRLYNIIRRWDRY
ncbi:peptidoglycan recognition protein-like [Lineus longissimus]|uniref:peptidoglycan recognition protein-like n=1 Tax=Lineus longissimus TaxID=88925 RepID=UPI002B4EFD1C